MEGTEYHHHQGHRNQTHKNVVILMPYRQMQYILIKSVYLMFPSQYLVFAALSAPHHGIDARSLWTSALFCRLCSRSLKLIPSLVFYLDDLKRDLFIFCMCVLHNMCACGLQTVSYPLELELEMVVSRCVGARNWTQVICKNKNLNHWVISQAYSSFSLLLYTFNLLSTFPLSSLLPLYLLATMVPHSY